ncbi:cupin-like domain-containing protein [Pseudocolwellia agarivorans]|uniref:cupin-like domain-containing protein n=1 Tax=Pseudocolwellia agarivorans TaxID=1911682 RepID=UPI000985C306|nr:cupin-like domain-containing protein [Pseudocolwellia agarivorans]
MLFIKNTVKTLFDVTPNNISEAILTSDEPLILKGFGSSWPIVKAAQQSNEQAVEYLKKMERGVAVNTCYLAPKEQGRIFYNDDMSGFNFKTKPQILSDVLTEILEQAASRQPKTIYIGSTSIKQILPSLVEETLASPLLSNAIYNIWLGNKSKVAAHFDFLQNLACCVVGKRRFTLFPPEQIKNLYCGPLDKAPGGQPISLVDFEQPDFEQFPKFKDAIDNAMVAELEAGDAIVLPSMWFHYVEGLGDLNVLLNHWWRTSPNYMGNPTDALHHAILSIRDLPTAQRNAWKHLFDHYVFEYEKDNFNHITNSAKSILNSPLDELQARALRANLQNKLRR